MTSAGLSFNSNGKMGQCLDTIATVSLNIPQSIYDVYSVADTEISYSLWVKIDKTYFNQLISETDFSTKTQIYNKIIGFPTGTTSNGLSIHLKTQDNLTQSTQLNQIYIYGHLRTGSANKGSTPQLINLDQWYHLVLSYSKTNVFSFYIDGVLINTQTITRGNTNTSITNKDIKLNIPVCQLSTSEADQVHLKILKEYFNDVRIYDHCLSPLEVKELSQGLMAHWTFTQQSIANGQVTDASGFNNDLNIINGTVSNDTAAYTTSTSFTDGQYAISPRQVGDWLPKEQMTVNLWTKWSTWGTPISCTQSGGWNFEQTSSSNGIQFPVYINTANNYKIAISKTTYASLAGNWHMLTGVFDGTSVKIYIDGIEKTYQPVTFTKDTIRYNTNTPLVISGEAKANLTTPENSAQIGNISDVRIYCTALSNTDIQLLYNTVMRMDNYNQIHCKEFIEQHNGSTNGTTTNLASAKIDSTTTATGLQYAVDTSYNNGTTPSIVNITLYKRTLLSNILMTSPGKYVIVCPQMLVYYTSYQYRAYHSSNYITKYCFRYNTYLEFFDNEDNSLGIYNIQNITQKTSSSPSGPITASQATTTIELPYNLTYSNNISYANLVVVYTNNQTASNSTNTSKNFTITKQTLITPQPIKITHNGQFYNRIIDQNLQTDAKVSFVRDGQIIAQDFIEY